MTAASRLVLPPPPPFSSSPAACTVSLPFPSLPVFVFCMPLWHLPSWDACNHPTQKYCSPASLGCRCCWLVPARTGQQTTPHLCASSGAAAAAWQLPPCTSWKRPSKSLSWRYNSPHTPPSPTSLPSTYLPLLPSICINIVLLALCCYTGLLWPASHTNMILSGMDNKRPFSNSFCSAPASTCIDAELLHHKCCMVLRPLLQNQPAAHTCVQNYRAWHTIVVNPVSTNQYILRCRHGKPWLPHTL